MPTSSAYIEALKRAGFRITTQRVAICDYLAAVKTHPTAPQVFEAVRLTHETLSLTTVYATLDTLAHLGMIAAFGGVGDDHVHYEPDPTPHVNLACESCHRIVDLDIPQLSDIQSEIGRRIGGQVREGTVMYHCDCIESKDPALCSHREVRAS